MRKKDKEWVKEQMAYLNKCIEITDEYVNQRCSENNDLMHFIIDNGMQDKVSIRKYPYVQTFYANVMNDTEFRIANIKYIYKYALRKVEILYDSKNKDIADDISKVLKVDDTSILVQINDDCYAIDKASGHYAKVCDLADMGEK